MIFVMFTLMIFLSLVHPQRQLRLVFERLSHHGVITNPQKCVVGASSVHFLGHLVDGDGIHPLPSKPLSTSHNQNHAANYEHFSVSLTFRFVLGCAKILDPLNSLLTSTTEHLTWDDTSTRAFIGIKKALADATLLVHLKPNALTSLMTDASNSAIGAVLQQYVNGQWQPISFSPRN